MSPGIFIESFERTDHSDCIHGVIGRSLIIATRFDAMCVTLSKAVDLKIEIVAHNLSEEGFDEVVNKVVQNYRSLNNSIQSFKLPEEISSILHKAREARNEIAHTLTKGLEGCLDIKVDEVGFIAEVSNLIDSIADGDLVISYIASVFSNESVPNSAYLSKYKSNIINWVIEK